VKGSKPATCIRQSDNGQLDQAWIFAPIGAMKRIYSREPDMRSTINLDDSLLERAKSLTGTKETAALVRQALETLVRIESGKRLIALGGTMPEAEVAPRRRSDVGR
jgi:Arc/MetJ family transcription regulator